MALFELLVALATEDNDALGLNSCSVTLVWPFLDENVVSFRNPFTIFDSETTRNTENLKNYKNLSIRNYKN